MCRILVFFLLNRTLPNEPDEKVPARKEKMEEAMLKYMTRAEQIKDMIDGQSPAAVADGGPADK